MQRIREMKGHDPDDFKWETYPMQTTDGNRHQSDPTPLQRRREFMERPLEERREIMRQQAKDLQQHYEDTLDERDDIQGGDIVEYDE